MVKKRIFVTLLILAVVQITACSSKTASYIEATEHQEDLSESEAKPADGQQEPDSTEALVYVYICGAVDCPGVYAMPNGSRICDLFTEAGGLTEDASPDYWNQARILNDGEMLYVPTKEEAKELSQTDREQAAGTGSESKTDKTKVNINTAGQEELMTLPGIGESKALAIIAYRTEKKGFRSIEELMEIAGIKEAVFNKIKDKITVG